MPLVNKEEKWNEMRKIIHISKITLNMGCHPESVFECCHIVMKRQRDQIDKCQHLNLNGINRSNAYLNKLKGIVISYYFCVEIFCFVNYLF